MELRSCCQFSTIFMLSALTMACGSAEDPNLNLTSGAAAGSTSGGASSSSGGGVTGCNLNTGFAGDELCILPPAPSEGFQIHYGPPSYDAEAVKPYLLEPGGEMTDCYFLKSPNPTKMFGNEYHGRMRPGSHHMIVYAQGKSVADGLQGCNQGADARFFVGAQTPTVDIPLDGTMPTPENEGLAMTLDPNTQLAIQLHYINTGTEPILREAWVNFISMPESEVKTLMDPIFFLAGVAMSVAPNTEKIIKGSGYASKDLRIIGATGHFHAHTVRFSAWHTTGGQKNLILEDFDWHHPSNFQFDSVHMNPAPDAANKTAGAMSGILNVKSGERIDWECHIINDSNVTLTFSNEVYTGEMCNFFGFYAPSMGGPWSAYNL